MTYTYLQNKSNFCLISPNCYPFGFSIPGRSFSSNSYRYGFNGKEKESETSQGDYDFEARIYDSKICRWLILDPLQAKYPFLSPYQFCANNPIYYIDPDGKDIKPSTTFCNSKYGDVYDILITSNTYWSLISSFNNNKKWDLNLEINNELIKQKAVGAFCNTGNVKYQTLNGKVIPNSISQNTPITEVFQQKNTKIDSSFLL